MAEKDLKIGIKTEATGDGAKKTAKELDQVAEATKRVAIAGEQGRQSRKDVDQFLRETEETTRVAQIGFYDLDAQMTRTANTSEKVAGAMVKANKPIRNNGAAILEFSRAVEDAQYGIRGVLNNIPTLIAMLGGGAGLAGAISLAAVGLTTLIPLLQKAFGGNTLKQAGIDLQKIREEAEKLAKAGLADTMKEIDTAAAERELQLAKNRAKTSETSAQDAAKRDAALQALDDREKGIGATNKLNSLLGLPQMPVDTTIPFERINLELDKQIAAQEKSIDKEREKVTSLKDGKEALTAQLRDLESNLATTEQVLRKSKEWGEEIERNKQRMKELREEAAKLDDEAEVAQRYATQSKMQQASELRARANARRSEADVIDSQLSPSDDLRKAGFKSAAEAAALSQTTAEERISGLEKKIADITALIEGQDVQIQNATVDLADKQAALDISVQKLRDTADLEQTVLAIDQATVESQATAERVKGFIAEVESSGKELNEEEKRGLAELKKLTADGQITRDEAYRAHDAISISLADTLSGVRRLVRLGEDARTDINNLMQRISRLEAMPRPQIAPIPNAVPR